MIARIRACIRRIRRDRITPPQRPKPVGMSPQVRAKVLAIHCFNAEPRRRMIR